MAWSASSHKSEGERGCQTICAVSPPFVLEKAKCYPSLCLRSCSNGLCTMDAILGKCEQVLREHDGIVYALAVAHDGLVVSGGDDKRVKLWVCRGAHGVSILRYRSEHSKLQFENRRILLERRSC